MNRRGRGYEQEYRAGIIAPPRSVDAVGRALRGAYGLTSLPDDMLAALNRLDRLPR